MANSTSIDSMEEWKEVTKSIHYHGPEIRADGIYYDVTYKGFYIARIRYDGRIEWLFHKLWKTEKKGWEFKVTYSKENKFIQYWKNK